MSIPYRLIMIMTSGLKLDRRLWQLLAQYRACMWPLARILLPPNYSQILRHRPTQTTVPFVSSFYQSVTVLSQSRTLFPDRLIASLMHACMGVSLMHAWVSPTFEIKIIYIWGLREVSLLNLWALHAPFSIYNIVVDSIIIYFLHTLLSNSND